MKTSLMVDDSLYRAAREEAARSGRSLSEVISAWARYGREQMAMRRTRRRSKPPTVDLGSAAQIDLTSRAGWMETLER